MDQAQLQPSPTCTLDSRSNVLRSWDATSSGSSQSVNGSPSYTYSFDTNHAFTYDLAGRETNDAEHYCSITSTTDPSVVPSPAPVLNSPRTYDAENHIIAQTLPAYYEPSSTACWTGADPTYPNTEVHSYTWGPMRISRRSASTLRIPPEPQRSDGMATICCIAPTALNSASLSRSLGFWSAPPLEMQAGSRFTIEIGAVGLPTFMKRAALAPSMCLV